MCNIVEFAHLGAGKYLTVPTVVVVDVNGHLGEHPHRVEGKVQLEGAHASILPAHPLVAWHKERTSCRQEMQLCIATTGSQTHAHIWIVG